MATVSDPTPATSDAAPHARVRHPLDRLRGTIRRYVALEGTLLLVLYAAIWFWLGVVLDFGTFKAFGLDWVQELPWGVRVFLLTVLSAGLLVAFLRLGYRLFRPFRDAALALVLEKRYPDVLGDRLITAVELADPKLAERYGYSRPMIDRTIADAADRVERLPIDDVLNWRRLALLGGVAAALAVGPYLLSLLIAVVTTHPHGARGPTPLGWIIARQAGTIHEVGSIWLERNILLLPTLWPRRAYVELVNFPEKGELRVGRDSPRPTLRARALKWVVADPTAPEGWRALRWQELARPELLGLETPMEPLPAAWFGDLVRASGGVDERRFDEVSPTFATSIPAAGDVVDWQQAAVKAGLLTQEQADELLTGWTVDQVELQLAADKDRPVTQKQLRPGATDKLEDVLHQLRELVLESRMFRRLRQLEVPDRVVLDYRGDSLQERPELTVQNGNEYAFDFAGLKESVRFTVRAEDYVTPSRLLTLVPPPQLLRLERAEARPAYLSERVPPGEDIRQLKGKRVAVADVPPVLVTGEVSRVDEIPVGTLLELTAEADKDLTGVVVKLAPRAPGGPKLPTAPATLDGLTVALVSPRSFKASCLVDTPLDVVFEFTDTDNVVGRRRVVIEPRKDTPPEVKVRVEVLRRIPTGDYLITNTAVVPISGEVRDDHGLEQLEYVYNYKRVETPLTVAVKASTGAVAVARLLQGPLTPDLFPVAFAALAQVDRSAAAAGMGSAPLVTWDRRRRATNRFIQEHLLDQEAARELRETSADFERFDLERLVGALKSSEDKSVPIPAHYELLLVIAAVDNNADTGPARRESERFGFRIVSENELLVEIGKEEENLHDKLRKAVDDLAEAQAKDLEEIIRDLEPAVLKPDGYRIMETRLKAVEDLVTKGEEKAVEVLRDYRRILAEMKANRVDKRMIEKVEEKICNPLGRIVDPVQGGFESTRDVLVELRRSLESSTAPDQKRPPLARQRLLRLIDDLRAVLESMGEITTINRVIASIVEIAKAEQKEYERLKRLQEKLEEEIINQTLDPTSPSPAPTKEKLKK